MVARILACVAFAVVLLSTAGAQEYCLATLDTNCSDCHLLGNQNQGGVIVVGGTCYPTSGALAQGNEETQFLFNSFLVVNSTTTEDIMLQAYSDSNCQNPAVKVVAEATSYSFFGFINAAGLFLEVTSLFPC